jgi:hypothetical protein
LHGSVDGKNGRKVEEGGAHSEQMAAKSDLPVRNVQLSKGACSCVYLI